MTAKQNQPLPPKWCILALLAVIGAGGLVRAWPVADQLLWFDEADTWDIALNQSYDKFLSWTHGSTHSPLSYLLARASMELCGTQSEWALRLPSLICGILCIPAVFALGRVVYSNTLGLLAATLIAFDPNMVDQSQQARMYAILALLAIIAITLTIAAIRHPENRSWYWTGIGIALGLALWTYPLVPGLWVGIALGVAGLLIGGWACGQPHQHAWRAISGMTMSFVIATVTASMGVYYAVYTAIHGSGRHSGMSLPGIAREIVVAMNDMINLTPAGLIVYPLAAFGMWLVYKQCKTSAAVLTGVAFMGIVILIPFRQQHHFMSPRYLAFIQPALWIGLAMLPLAVKPERLRVGLAGAMAFYIGLQAWQCTNLHRWWMQPDRYKLTEILLETQDQIAPEDAVVYHPQQLHLIGKYYGVDPHEQAEAGIYDRHYKTKPDPHIPNTLDAPATWLMIGMANHQERLDQARVILDAIAKHYGVAVEESIATQHFVPDHAIVARIDRRGVEMKSLGADP